MNKDTIRDALVQARAVLHTALGDDADTITREDRGRVIGRRIELLSAALRELDSPGATMGERIRLARGFLAYCLHVPLHWASFALLPYAGDWIYRRERAEGLDDDCPF